MPKAKSKAQWRKLGQLLSEGEITREEFDKRVHGVNYKKLPGKVGKKRGRIVAPTYLKRKRRKATRTERAFLVGE